MEVSALVLVGFVLVVLTIVYLVVIWKRRRPEKFEVEAYRENLAALPSGISLYLSAFSDASTSTVGKWVDLSGKGHDFTFDRSASAPLSTDPGARGFDLAGCVLLGPPAVDLLPTAGQDFSLVWVARDATRESDAASTIFKLRANTPTNNGIQVAILASNADSSAEPAVVSLAAAVGSGAAGVWRFPASPELAVHALVRHGPSLAFFRNGVRIAPTSEAGAADDGMLFSNPAAAVNPDGAWSGRLGAVALWGRALEDLDVAAVTAHLRAEAGDLPRVRAESKATQAAAEIAREKALRDALEDADRRARAGIDAAIASSRQAVAQPAKAQVKELRLREGFKSNIEQNPKQGMYERLAEDQIQEATDDAIALLNGSATVCRV